MRIARLTLVVRFRKNEIRIHKGASQGFHWKVGVLRAKQLFLRAAFRFHALLFLPFHFFLALLKRGFRRSHTNLLEWEARADRQSCQRTCSALPARFARLPWTVAIILGREPATLARISAPPSAASAVSIAIAVAVKAATAATSATPSRATTAATGRGFGARLINFQRSPAYFLAVQA